MVEFIHITAAYSNAVLAAILPQVSDFAKDAGLVVTPITTNQVQSCLPDRVLGRIDGQVVLTNGFWFSTDFRGYVDGFRSPRDLFYYQDPSDWEGMRKWFGKVNVSTNTAISVGRDVITKLGYKLEWFGATNAPTTFEGLLMLDTNTIPFCNMCWDMGNGYFKMHYDLERKEIVAISVGMMLEFTEAHKIGKPVKVDVAPEVVNKTKGKPVQGYDRW